MKKRLFFISLVLALVMTTLMPGAVLAAKPADFSASGGISDIKPPTDIWQAGKSDRWVVVEREITGTLSGDINGDFTMTYRGNFDLSTQAGTFHGTVESGSYVLKVNGRIEPLVFVGWYVEPCQEYPEGIPYLELTIKGRWLLTEGAKGEGALDAWAIFIPDELGHVAFITNSHFELTGKWQ